MEFRNKSLPTFSDSSYGGVSSLRPQIKALPIPHEDRHGHAPFPQVGVAFRGGTSRQLCLTEHLMREKAGAPCSEVTRVLSLRERKRNEMDNLLQSLPKAC